MSMQDPHGQQTPTGSAVLTALPSPKARAIAFAGICTAGMLGAVAGYGVVDLLCDGGCAVWLVGGAMLAALIAAFGAAILAVVGLRAAGYWQSVDVNAQTTPLGPISDESA